MYDRTLLLKDCQGLVKRLEKDIRERTTSDPDLAAAASKRYQEAIATKKTAMAENAWLSEQVTQAAVAWALGTVFVRFCEDNGLIDQAWIAGPVDDDATRNRFRQSELAREAYIVEHPTHSDVQYLHAAFRALGAYPATKDLFAADRNPLWTLPVSAQGARHLLSFWRETDRDGKLLRDLWIEDIGDTRWLGDLYQDMSADARKRYALLQTPDFVEEFILDYTLTPAVKTFGLKNLRCIDPTCGSGHFLLGILKRLIVAWEQELGPTGSRKEAVSRAMRSVYGIDLNPFAVAISRFRLVLAGMAACAWRRLKDAPAFGCSLAVGNTLTYGGERGIGMQTTVGGEHAGEVGSFLVPGDYQAAKEILTKCYHVVVGNPPYISVKDAAERELIKKNFTRSCYKKWTLSVPFTERFFNLAQDATDPDTKGNRPAGFVGLINSNNFTKREFGKALIEQVLPGLDLTHVIDTSGCYIPGHGTPTVILFGRNQCPPPQRPVRAVQGIRGEPGRPENAADGMVWNAMVETIAKPGSVTLWLSVSDVDRRVFGQHPWSLGGGGIKSLFDLLEKDRSRLCECIADTGFGAVTREDEVFQHEESTLRRMGVSQEYRHSMFIGESIRDWVSADIVTGLWPYNRTDLEPELSKGAAGVLWPQRTQLAIRIAYGKTQVERGLKWFEYSMFFKRRYGGLTITWSEIATHNRFILVREPAIFTQTAPIAKLKGGATDEDHLDIVSLLNSSTISFWCRQVCHCKGAQGINEGGKSEAWEQFIVHNSTNIEKAPVVTCLRTERHVLSRRLDSLGRNLSALQPGRLFINQTPTRQLIDQTAVMAASTRSEMIFLQEELDWLIYRAYGILSEAECPLYTAGAVPLVLGERAFEIDLARMVVAEELETGWFERHRSSPITDIPAHWPADYQQVVQRRLDLIANHPHIGLLEKPEHKRRWQSDPWDEVVQAGLYSWLCDRLEDRNIWPDEPRLTSAQELADRLFTKPEVLEAAALFRGNDIFDRVKLVEELLLKETVPFIPALRYTDEGMLKRADWEVVWDLQRREDRGESVNIPVPPRYAKEDFRKGSFWDNRGKLDVPKERFISYPGAEREPDTSTLVLWAGYDHAQQAKALIEHYQWAKSTAGWDEARLIPLLIGLDQLVPWIKQWHNEMDPTYGSRFGDVCSEFLLGEMQDLGVSQADLRAWRPTTVAARRGRKRKGEA